MLKKKISTGFVRRGALAVCLFLQGLISVSDAAESAYLIQPGDVLQVSVWKEPDLQSEVLVRPDGGISFPLAGDLSVQGLSVAQVTELVTKKIERYIPDPVVTVATKQIGGNRIYVIGKVARPGEFAFIKPLDVMQALSLGGGTTAYASVSDIYVLRRDQNGKQVAIPFDYGRVENGKSLESNIVLQSGDTVVVP